MRLPLLVLGSMLASCTARGGDDVKAANVTIADAWAQPFDKAGTSAAVYMTLAVPCPAAPVLESVSTPAPATASLQASSVVDNALVTKPVRSVAVPCGGPTLLKPMSTHIVVTDLPTPVGVGSRIPVTLSFGASGTVTATAEVTTAAVLEDVDPMRMHARMKPGMAMDHMH